jgi:hypothetical protein
MSITWKDGVTTLSTAGAILIERAYFHDWSWPLVSSLRWVIAGTLGLIAISFVFSYVLDKVKGIGWTAVATMIGALAFVLAGLGLYFNDSDYLVLLILSAVAFWLASIVRHVSLPAAAKTSHA